MTFEVCVAHIYQRKFEVEDLRRALPSSHWYIISRCARVRIIEDSIRIDDDIVSLDDATEELLLGCDHLFVDDWTLVSDDDTRLLGRLAGAGRVAGPIGSRPRRQEHRRGVRHPAFVLARVVRSQSSRPAVGDREYGDTRRRG
ncbi:hypothetical protein [Alloactinosynnema sp. L-07]|uniref:hypothetical protein n=1 Tax=Alloactinosynnema sp. L-07 TaxID=1653480 RepID=UPI0012F8B7F9|nr:hypothetical protein [Alloactinosynnema sp. L-07]